MGHAPDPKNGKCEVSKDMDCAWMLIYERLERLGQLDKMRRYYPARNYQVVPRPRRIVVKSNVLAGDENA